MDGGQESRQERAVREALERMELQDADERRERARREALDWIEQQETAPQTPQDTGDVAGRERSRDMKMPWWIDLLVGPLGLVIFVLVLLAAALVKALQR